MLKQAKRCALATLKGLGLFRALSSSRWRTERLAILGYHGVSLRDEHLWDPYLYMSPDSLEARFALLREHHYSVLKLDEAVRRLQAGDLPTRSVVLTFDDGLSDFRRTAFPLLKKYNLPATVYLTTYYCGKNTAVFDLVTSYVLWKGRASRADLRPLLDVDVDVNSEVGRHRAWTALQRLVREKAMSAAEENDLVERLAHVVGVDYDEIRRARLLHLMTPDEIAEVSAGGIDVQLHTHRHRTPADRTLFEREVVENRSRIAAITGQTPMHFCYPNGHYRREFLPWLDAHGIRSATTCDTGLADRRNHRLLLPRVLDHSRLSLIEFEGWLTGMSSFFPRKRHRPSPDLRMPDQH